MRDLAFVGLIGCMVPLAFLCPINPILVWAWAAMVNPNYQLYGGFLGSLPYQKAFAILAILFFCAGAMRRRFHLDLSLVLMMVFLALETISELVTPFPTSGGWAVQDGLMKVIVLALLVSWAMTDRLSLHSLLLAVAAGLAYGPVWEGVLFFISGGSHQIKVSPTGTDNNNFGLYVDMSIPLFLYLYRQSSNRLLRLGMLAVTFLSVGCVIATRSRGGFVGLAVEAIALALVSKRKISSLLVIALVGTIFAAAAPSSWTERMDTIKAADQDSSFLGRVMAWKMSVLIAFDRPLIGAGPYGVEFSPVWNHYRLEFDTLSSIPSLEPNEHPLAAHSIYFEVLGDTGFLGISIFLAMIGAALLNARKVRKLTRGRPDLEWAYQLARACELSLIVLLVAGAALSAAYFELNYLMIGVISATRRQVLDLVREEARIMAFPRVPIQLRAAVGRRNAASTG